MSEWRLAGFDAALAVQTYRGRPMTTHHTLEIDRALPPERWADAAVALVEQCPELASRVRFGSRVRRFTDAPNPAAARDRVEIVDGGRDAIEAWIGRPLELEREWPFRIGVAPGELAAQAVTLTLHHSVTDGHGALALFDRLLELAQGKRPPPRAGASAQRARRGASWRALLERAAGFARPCAELRDLVPAGTGGHALSVRVVPIDRWRALAGSAAELGVSRNTLLWLAAARAVAALRHPPGLPLRMLVPVDLRAELGVPADALGNWIGTVELDVDPDAVSSAADTRRLDAELRRGRPCTRSLATPAVLAALTRVLPQRLARACFRRVDSERWPHPYTMLLSHIRPRPARPWPEALAPRLLWCTSLLPRSPGLGLTVTTIADRVSVAVSWRTDALRRATVEAVVDRWLDDLALAPGRAHARARSQPSLP
jgi:hypothetical protein